MAIDQERAIKILAAQVRELTFLVTRMYLRDSVLRHGAIKNEDGKETTAADLEEVIRKHLTNSLDRLDEITGFL